MSGEGTVERLRHFADVTLSPRARDVFLDAADLIEVLNAQIVELQEAGDLLYHALNDDPLLHIDVIECSGTNLPSCNCFECQAVSAIDIWETLRRG